MRSRRHQSPTGVALCYDHTRPTKMLSAAILMYHRVANLTPDVNRLCVSPDVFRQHMEALRVHGQPMTLADLGHAVVDGDSPPRAVAVTFDDGCLDNLTVASEILQEFDIPATFFVPTEQLNQKREYWWDTLERIFADAGEIPLVLDLPGDAETYRTDTAETRAKTHDVLAVRMRQARLDEREHILAHVMAWADIDLSPRDTHRPMVADELLTLSQSPGHTLGAHSVHHLSLPTLEGAAQRSEILDSKAMLESLVGVEVTAFAYPYGHYDAASAEITGTAFKLAVTAMPGTITRGANRTALPRIDASRLTIDDLSRLVDSL